MSTNLVKKFCVLGAGSWGTTLAYLLAQNGHEVMLWTRQEIQAQAINTTRENKAYLPGLNLPTSIKASANLSESVKAGNLIWALPTKAIRVIMEQLPEVSTILSCSKGLESGSFETVTEILAEYQPRATLGALSGPNLAKEIAAGKPAAATVASNDESFAREAQQWFNQPAFRVYSSNDLKGVELAGAFKNVIALAAGMSDGLALGDNAKATLLTRGLAELIRLGQQLSGKSETLYGLAGLGDMIATCSSPQSRNHTAGDLFAQGKTLEDIEALGLTAEGIPTVKAVYLFAQEHKLELPISTEIYQVIYSKKSPLEAISDLMQRKPRSEV